VRRRAIWRDHDERFAVAMSSLLPETSPSSDRGGNFITWLREIAVD
jgi:hypothetical protein